MNQNGRRCPNQSFRVDPTTRRRPTCYRLDGHPGPCLWPPFRADQGEPVTLGKLLTTDRGCLLAVAACVAVWGSAAVLAWRWWVS